MNDTNALHNASMDRAESAMLARLRKDSEESRRLFKEAFDLELQAIEAYEKKSSNEPTYSILHRSAATLALDCGEPLVAEKIIAKALAKDPPSVIAEELRDLLENVYFSRHLQLRGITLEDDELQMSLAGQGVGYGVVHSSEFLQRVDDASKIIYRIAERKQKLPFRERGRMKQSVKDDYELFISVPRAASFAVTLKLGRPAAQQTLPGISIVSEIVDEFMDLINLVNQSRFRDIEARIPDTAYRTNFIQLAKRLAPDGNSVKVVGFTTSRKGKEAFVELTKSRDAVVLPGTAAVSVQQIEQKVTVSGVLKYADATHKDSGQIKLIEENTNKVHVVKVPEGMMNDIVKPLWDSVVIIKGVRSGQYIILEDIEEKG